MAAKGDGGSLRQNSIAAVAASFSGIQNVIDENIVYRPVASCSQLRRKKGVNHILSKAKLFFDSSHERCLFVEDVKVGGESAVQNRDKEKSIDLRRRRSKLCLRLFQSGRVEQALKLLIDKLRRGCIFVGPYVQNDGLESGIVVRSEPKFGDEG